MLNFIRGLVFLDSIIPRLPVSHFPEAHIDQKPLIISSTERESKHQAICKSTWSRDIYRFLCKPEKLGSGLPSISEKITAIAGRSIRLR